MPGTVNVVIGAALPRGIAVVGFLAVGWTSCASPQSAGGANADCFRIEDCQEGLVCAPADPKNPGQKKCTRDLSAIQGMAPMSGGGQGGAAGANGDGSPDAQGDGAPAGGGSPGDASSGGVPSTGGAPATDGSPVTGGAPATGGAPVDAAAG